MTTEKLHEILDDENRELTIEELCQVLYELKTDCFQKYSEEFEANKIPTSQFYLGEQNAFQICLDLMGHLKSSDILGLINRQKAEIEKLKERCSKCGEKTTKNTLSLQEILGDKIAEIERLHIENESLRTAGNSLKMHLENAEKEIERLTDTLYDADGVNLVNYWYQQCEMAENGCRNFEEENKNLKAEIEELEKKNADLQGHLTQMKMRYDNAKVDLASLNEKVDFVGNLEDIRKEIEVEAYKKFAEQLKKWFTVGYVYAPHYIETVTNNLVKEKVEASK